MYLEDLFLWLLAGLHPVQVVLVDSQSLVVVRQHVRDVRFSVVGNIVDVITVHAIQVRLVGTYVGAIGRNFITCAKVIAYVLESESVRERETETDANVTVNVNCYVSLTCMRYAAPSAGKIKHLNLKSESDSNVKAKMKNWHLSIMNTKTNFPRLNRIFAL